MTLNTGSNYVTLRQKDASRGDRARIKYVGVHGYAGRVRMENDCDDTHILRQRSIATLCSVYSVTD